MDNYNPDWNIFMKCSKLNLSALTELPQGFSLRPIRRDELDLWMRMPFDGNETVEHMDGMREYFAQVYAPREDLFYQKCLFAVDADDTPVGTCFTWKAYGKITTIHWLKVLQQYENRGIGRALISHVMREVLQADYPIYLHTQLGSYRAIKLYSDFGFEALLDERVGLRENHIELCLPHLAALMPKTAFDALSFTSAGSKLLTAADQVTWNEF